MNNAAAIISITSMNNSGGGLVWDPNACDSVTFLECSFRAWPVLVVFFIIWLVLYLNKISTINTEKRNAEIIRNSQKYEVNNPQIKE